MPTAKQMTTLELLDELKLYELQQEVADIIAELNDRVIKEGDDDDIVQGNVNTTRGGIRPNSVPLVP